MARPLHITLGEELEVEYEGRWYPCHVMRPPKPGEKVHVFVRWGNSTPAKMTVGRDRLRRKK